MNKKYQKWGLWLRIALPLLLFVVVGSIVLCASLYANARRESDAVFATLARTNADFIRTSHLPVTERMARELGRILDMQVFFREPNGTIVPPLSGEPAQLQVPLKGLRSSAGVSRPSPSCEAIATPIDPSHDLLLIRPAPDFRLMLRPLTLLMLASFWALSLVLAWTLTRGVVKPLRALADHLPKIENEELPSLPGAERADDIGLLARTYLETHRQLAHERKEREKAERLALLGKMATGLAHEINNPLSSIRMHAQLLESATPPELSAATTIPIILGETTKIESLVNQWMFLARPAPPETSPAGLRALVEGVVRSMQPQADHARVAIATDVPQFLEANVDARRIRQAIGNIIINAIQAMPTGGALRISGNLENHHIRLDFQDTGKGFSANALLHHADLFYSEKEGGMGIGLSVSQEIIKAHRGSIEIANLPQGGARVSIILPSSYEMP